MAIMFDSGGVGEEVEVCPLQALSAKREREREQFLQLEVQFC